MLLIGKKYWEQKMRILPQCLLFCFLPKENKTKTKIAPKLILGSDSSLLFFEH